MKIIQYFFLILLICLFNNNLFAGLGNKTIGAGGFKTDIEVNEIEEIEVEDEDSKSEGSNEFKSIELKEIDPNSIGVLTEDEGGLNYSMWEGSKVNIIEEYLKDLPINIESDLAIELVKRILLSSAEAPKGSNENNLILIRIKKLIELGDLESAKSLIEAISEKNNEEILMKQTEINISLNNFDLVCTGISEKRKKFKENFFWRKVEIFCQILNEELNKANLSLSLLKEDSSFNDENFLKIIDSLLYKEELIGENLTNLDLLNMAMTRVANINLNENYVLEKFNNEDKVIVETLTKIISKNISYLLKNKIDLFLTKTNESLTASKENNGL